VETGFPKRSCLSKYLEPRSIRFETIALQESAVGPRLGTV
jgi:hypothetical protein